MKAIEFLTPEHIKSLAPRIREADKREVYASHRVTDMEKCLLNSLEMSHEAWCWVIDGVPVAAFGVTPGCYLTRMGIPWLLASDEIYDHIHDFLKTSKIIVDYWRNNWDMLSNYVDARNIKSIKWLKFLGFIIDEPTIYGLEKLPFHRFEIKWRKNV